MSAKSLSDIRCFLLDMDGTFYLGNRLLDGALYFMEVIRRQERDFVFLTNNSSNRAAAYAQKISALGFPLSPQKVFTSGEATARFLQREFPTKPIYLVGTPALEEEFREFGLHLVQENAELVVVGFDTTLTYQKLHRLCDYVRAGLPFIATHPDYNCPTEDGYLPDIGAILAFVKASTGREPDLIIGKPHRQIIDELARKLQIPLQNLAMIGDRLYTDIALGQAANITTILVLSGETKLEDVSSSPFQPHFIFENLGKIAEHLSQLERQA
jgi:HAD superfamily hydrolase (TIGR01450 family)